LTEPVTKGLIKIALPLPPVIRYLVALTWLAVPGILAGMPFPLAMRYYLVTPVDRAYAWTANGCTSVLASIVAAQLAISQGLFAILVGGTLAYVTALVCALFMRQSGKMNMTSP
jgi:hypothetical protein